MADKFELKGKIYKFGELKEFDSGYKKKDVLVETQREFNDKTFTDIIKFIADRNRVDALSAYSIGDEINVGFTISGRMWEPKDGGDPMNFTELKIIYMSKVVGSTPTATPEQNSAQITGNAVQGIMEVDDLPF